MMDATEFKKLTNATDATVSMYNTWRDLLTHWNKKINLVASPTISNFWLRHALDSYQLTSFVPKQAQTILDMGSGAGFPGLAFAICAKQEQSGQHVTLVESNGKKCNFLRAVIRELGLQATVMQERAENIPPKPYDVISARAFAPLGELLAYSAPFWAKDTLAIFPKGARYEEEVAQAKKSYNFEVTAKPSQTSDEAQILLIADLAKLSESKQKTSSSNRSISGEIK